VEEGVPYIAMEVLDGEDLGGRLERVGTLTPEATARVLTHVARAIGKAHELGIVHRDLKPDNIFIVHNEDEEVAKVLDFGVAKASSQGLGSGKDATTRTGAVIGTPQYMSPEQARGDRAVDWRSDLWALGVIAFECLVGVRPFEAEGVGTLLVKICAEEIPVPSSMAPVPEGFDAWFARATQRDPDQRFQSAREMVDALRTALLGDEAGPTSNPAASARFEGAADQTTEGRARPHPTTTGIAATEMEARSTVRRRSGMWLVAGLGVAAAAGGVLWLTRSAPPDANAAAVPPSESAPAAASEQVEASRSPTIAPALEKDEGDGADEPAEMGTAPEPVAEPRAPAPSLEDEAASDESAAPEPPTPKPRAAPPPRPKVWRAPKPKAEPAPAPAPAPEPVRDIGF
jgi:serine/threonine-protein kinase